MATLSILMQEEVEVIDLDELKHSKRQIQCYCTGVEQDEFKHCQKV